MKKLLGILVLGFFITGCSKIPKSAFNCFDTQTNKRIFFVIFDKDWSRIFSKNNWVFDKISRYNEDFWEPYRKKPMFVKNEYVIRYYEDINTNRQLKKFKIKKGKDKGKTFNLSLTNYRNTYFNLDTKSFEIYEYYHPIRVSKDNFNIREDDYGLNINITFYKKFKCIEDKELYKEWKKIG